MTSQVTTSWQDKQSTSVHGWLSSFNAMAVVVVLVSGVRSNSINMRNWSDLYTEKCSLLQQAHCLMYICMCICILYMHIHVYMVNVYICTRMYILSTDYKEKHRKGTHPLQILVNTRIYWEIDVYIRHIRHAYSTRSPKKWPHTFLLQNSCLTHTCILRGIVMD